MIVAEQRTRVDLASDELDVVLADTPDRRLEAYRLRHQVYCVERGFEPGNNGIESDEYDERAGHVLLIHRDSGTVVGTVRIVPPATATFQDFPMTKACQRGLLRELPLRTTGEISRFALSKQRRLSYREHTMMRVGLMQGIVRLSDRMGLTHWCAIMEPILLRLLRMNAIYFTPLGPLVEYHGSRQPTCGHIETVLNRIKFEQWAVWNYITQGGKLGYQNNSKKDQRADRVLLVA